MTEAKCDYCGNHTECSSASFGRWICPVCKASGLDEIYDEGAEVDEAERGGVTGSSFLWKNVEVDLEPDEAQVADIDLDWAPDESEINTDLPEPEWDEESEPLSVQQLREKLSDPGQDFKREAASDGSSANYYKLPRGAAELQDLISFCDMNAQLGEIFRACYRYGRAPHSDHLRDAKKMKFYIEAEIARLERYER